MRARAVVLLSVACVLVIAAGVAVVIGGARVIPGRSEAEARVAGYADVTAAGRKAVTAFLDVDYKDMDTRIDKVVSLSTGTFKSQYKKTAIDLKGAAGQAHAVSVGTVEHVSINRFTENSAVLLIVASNVVTNTDTTNLKADATCPHAGARCDQYRFMVTMKRVKNRWLLSDLAGVS